MKDDWFQREFHPDEEKPPKVDWAKFREFFRDWAEGRVPRARPPGFDRKAERYPGLRGIPTALRKTRPE